MLTEEQLSQLTGGGECFIHVHPQEPLNFDDHSDLMGSDPIREITSDYTPTVIDFRIRADTTGGDIRITMPPTASGREFQITKKVSANRLFIIPTPPDTIIGSTTGVIVRNAYTSLHCKAVEEGWEFA